MKNNILREKRIFILFLFILFIIPKYAYSQSDSSLISFETILSVDHVGPHNIWFSDIIESEDNNFYLTGRIYDYKKFYHFADSIVFYKLSPAGDLLSESYKSCYKPGYEFNDKYIFIENRQGELLLFTTYVPVYDTTNENYLGYTTAKLVLDKLDKDFNTVMSKEYIYYLDSTYDKYDTSYNYPNGYQYPPTFNICSVIDKSTDDLVISLDKNLKHLYKYTTKAGNPVMILHDSTERDSTFFLTLDYDFTVKKKSYIAHPICNYEFHCGEQHKMTNNLLYDYSLNNYFYYRYFNSGYKDEPHRKGLSIYCLDEDFQLLYDSTLHPTTHTSSFCVFFRNSNFTFHRTNRQTTLFAGGIELPKINNMYYMVSCWEITDYPPRRVDSVNLGSLPYHSGLFLTRSPENQCLDFYDEDRVFIGTNYDSYYGYGFEPVPVAQFFILTCINHKFNRIKEFYYNVTSDSVFQWINYVKATKDGGCLIGGNFWNFHAYPSLYESIQNAESLITKFSPESFSGIEEAHKSGLSLVFVYPNPGTEELNIRTTLENSSVIVTDMLGNIMYQDELSGTITQIDSRLWSRGTYLWRVLSNGNVVESGKWIKQ